MKSKLAIQIGRLCLRMPPCVANGRPRGTLLRLRRWLVSITEEPQMSCGRDSVTRLDELPCK